MEIHQLRVIDAVARTGSITAAAKELHHAQASVSHHLSRLQERVGAVLTRRRGRGIVLTPEGDLLARRAREILRRMDETESDIKALSRQLQSRLRIAAFQSALLELVPPALQSMRAAYENIALELRESHPTTPSNSCAETRSTSPCCTVRMTPPSETDMPPSSSTRIPSTC